MAMNCWAQFGEQNFDLDKILDRVIVCSPQSYSELIALLYNVKYFTENRKIRLIVVDSLSFLRYSIENTLERTKICFKILDELNKLSLKYNLAVVITNELINQVTSKGQIDLAPAGGTLCAHRVHKRLRLTRLNNSHFAACVIKSPTVPKVTAKFQITADGIRDINK